MDTITPHRYWNLIGWVYYLSPQVHISHVAVSVSWLAGSHFHPGQEPLVLSHGLGVDGLTDCLDPEWGFHCAVTR